MGFENPGDGQRCDHCDQPGEPYEHNGEPFSGLFANRGEQLCQRCLDRAVTADNNAPTGWAGVPASHYITPKHRG